jgi:hypothetical protein
MKSGISMGDNIGRSVSLIALFEGHQIINRQMNGLKSEVEI